MCWQSNSKNMQISDGNVKVKKICRFVNGNLCGYFYKDFTYALNTEYHDLLLVLYLDLEHAYVGTKGFHSYSADKCQILYNQETRLFEIWKDSYSTMFNTFINFKKTVVVVEGYIPKGGVYHINEDGEIISNSIVLTRIQEL